MFVGDFSWKALGMATSSEVTNDWQTAFRKCTSQLKPEETIQIFRVTSYEDLQSSIATLEANYRQKRISKVLSRIEPFLSNLRSFQGVVDTAIQAKPDVAALIWGGIKLVLEASVAMIRSYNR